MNVVVNYIQCFRYESEGQFIRQVEARKLFFSILDAQVETGVPYMLYKDSCNRKSNQQNLGTIKCSNLCTEIIEYTNKDEVGVLNLIHRLLLCTGSGGGLYPDRNVTPAEHVSVSFFRPANLDLMISKLISTVF